MDNYYDIEEPKKGFSVGKVFKWLALLVIAAVYVALMARCVMSRDHAIVSEVIADEELTAAYMANPAAFTVEQYAMNNAWVAVEEGRLLEFNNLYYVDAAHQLQFSMKYNEDIAVSNGEDGLPFRFYLTDEEDAVYDSYYFKTASRFNFRFIRLSFKGITLLRDGVDENGTPLRKQYTLHVERLEADGGYEDYATFPLYDGAIVHKEIAYNG